jgi:hypothetical protein
LTKGERNNNKKTKDPSKHKNPKGVTKGAKEQIIDRFPSPSLTRRISKKAKEIET